MQINMHTCACVFKCNNKCLFTNEFYCTFIANFTRKLMFCIISCHREKSNFIPLLR